MNFGSLFTGIGGFDLGFEQAGMECAWQVEYDAKARSVLQRHWPDAALYNDVHHVYAPGVHSAGGSYLEPVDLVCGGFPCQDLSVAGKRAGLAGERSGLWFEFHRILTELRPQWVVIENVPGLLSSNRGADFAVILQGLVELRYGVTWRVFDAQYFGVAQLRRRVFFVGSLGDGRSAQVLFEREGLFGHPPARRAQGQSLTPSVGAQPPSRRNGGSDPTTGTMIAGTLAAGAHPGSYNGNDAQRGNLVSFDWQTAGSERTSIVDEQGATRGLSSSKTLAIAFTQNTRDEVRQIGGDGQIAGALGAQPGMKQQNYVLAYALADATGTRTGTGRDAQDTFIFEPRYARNGRGAPDTIAPPLKAQNGDSRIMAGVRRLTPTECERLQGFPDGHTAGQSDSARYRQLGNAVAVPVARWIGERIMIVSNAD